MNRLFLLFALAMGIIMSGCNVVEVKTKRLRPAKYNLAGAKVLVILPIKDKSGQGTWKKKSPDEIANQIREELVTAKMPGSDEAMFKVYGPSDVRDALEQQKIQASDLYAPEHTAKIGELLGADAIVKGEITTLKIKIHPPRQQRLEEKADTQGALNAADSLIQGKSVRKSYVREGTANLTVAYRIVNVETAQNILAENMPVKSLIQKSAGEKDKIDKISEEDVYVDAIAKIAKEFRAAVAPYQEDVTVKLEVVDHGEWNRALNFAKSGRWDSAAPVFQKMAKEVQDPAQKASANYGWGVSLHYNNQFKKAQAVLEAAMQGNPKPLYQSQIDAVAQSIKDLEKVKQQVEDRETADEEAEM